MPDDTHDSSSETSALLLARDWSATALGPREQWPARLTTVLELALDSGLPTLIWWGGEFVQLYNDAAIAILGARHPAAFGEPAGAHADADWPELERLAGAVLSSGRAGRCRLRRPGGGVQPGTVTWCAAALRADDGTVAGVVFTVVDLAEPRPARNSIETTGIGIQTRTQPGRNELSGDIAEWLATSTDVDDSRKWQEKQRVLLAELQHRVRNMLAVIRSIARRTADSSRTVSDFAAHLEGRINALARTQALVTRDPSAGVKLDYLVAEELAACGARENDGGDNGAALKIEGPDVRLRSKAAEMFALAIHELATNAIKHGVLAPAARDGRLHIEWHLISGDAPRLSFSWHEIQAQPLSRMSKRRGFGREFIEQTLRYELDAASTLSIDGTGLRCDIVVPLTDRVWLAPPP